MSLVVRGPVCRSDVNARVKHRTENSTGSVKPRVSYVDKNLTSWTTVRHVCTTCAFSSPFLSFSSRPYIIILVSSSLFPISSSFRTVSIVFLQLLSRGSTYTTIPRSGRILSRVNACHYRSNIIYESGTKAERLLAFSKMFNLMLRVHSYVESISRK